MRRMAACILILVMCVLLAACSGGNDYSSGTAYTNNYGTPSAKCAHPGCSNNVASSGDTNCCVTHSNKCLNCSKYIDGDAMYCMSCLTSAAKGSSAASAGSFTNKYGTPTTKCARSGCNNKIASSGDTNCCVTHSNKCLNCSKYIDGDAMYCMSCLTSAAKGSSAASADSFTNKYGTPTTKCARSGCNNKIASSGDTNCCVTHSNKCLNCSKYIDGDAMYCMSCLTSAAGKSSSSSYSGSSKKSTKNKCSFKQGGKEVCSSPRASGSNFCSYHTQYLNDAYDSLFGY